VPAVKVNVSVSPEAVAETMGGVVLGGGCGSGQDTEAVPVATHVAGEGCEADGVVPPQAHMIARARIGASGRNVAFNGGEG
jgi:hypothetical protein